MNVTTKFDSLVVGADSLIGGHVVNALAAAGAFYQATSRRADADALRFDLANPSFGAFDNKQFGFAVVCAAVSNMRTCEADPQSTRGINVEGTLRLLRRLAQSDTPAVFLSSSQVFDGEVMRPDEAATCSPKNAYGRQKREVEEAIADEQLPVAVLRVPKVLARWPVAMFATWYDRLAQGDPIVAANNMPLAPVSAEDVAAAAIRLGSQRRTGIWHLSSSDEVPYHQAALWLAEVCGMSPALVDQEAVTEEKVPGIYRHRYAALAADKIASGLGMPIRTSETVLRDLFGDFPKHRNAA